MKILNNKLVKYLIDMLFGVDAHQVMLKNSSEFWCTLLPGILLGIGAIYFCVKHLKNTPYSEMDGLIFALGVFFIYTAYTSTKKIIETIKHRNILSFLMVKNLIAINNDIHNLIKRIEKILDGFPNKAIESLPASNLFLERLSNLKEIYLTYNKEYMSSITDENKSINVTDLNLVEILYQQMYEIKPNVIILATFLENNYFKSELPDPQKILDMYANSLDLFKRKIAIIDARLSDLKNIHNACSIYGIDGQRLEVENIKE